MSSAAKKQKGQAYPTKEAAERQESLRATKMHVEQLKEKLQKSIIDNPILSKKAAVLISMWIDGKEKKSKR